MRCNDDYSIDEMETYTGKDIYKAVYTITIAELSDAGIFDWSKDYLDWSDAAFDDEQYQRVCNYFTARFYYREISMKPFLVWANYLQRKLVYELMPKYRPLYAAVKEGFNPIASNDEIYKERAIGSKYPQTLLGGNADYATDGTDREYERIRYDNPIEQLQKYSEAFHSVDEMLLDELEIMFIGLYNANTNLW